MIVVAQDVEGLRIAAREVFEAAMNDKNVQNVLDSINPDDLAQLSKLVPKSQVSPGYHDRILYLLWLEDKMRANITFSEIAADEAEGIASIQRARYEFDKEFPLCGDCGNRNRQGMRHVCPERMKRERGVR